MPPRTISDADLLDRLLAVFRQVGFPGATLTGLAQATGMGKSSLYHRFPGGKEQMAVEVATAVAERFGADVLAPLAGPGPLDRRLAQVGAALERFYEGGTANCLLDTLTLSVAGEPVLMALRRAASGWVGAFTTAAQEAGHPPARARQRAEDAVAAIEGGLVLARVTGDTGPFRRAARRLPEALTT